MAKDGVSTFLQDTFLEIVKERLEKAETVEEAKEITKKLEKIDLSDLFREMFFKMADDTTQYMRETMFEEVMAFRAEEDEFIIKQEQKWYKGFVASEAMYIMTLEAVEAYVNYVNDLSYEEKFKHHNTFTAMLHIHGRALQEFLEIITLMKNGFADGAYARWRSMYELSIIASFITENGEKVAKEFIEAEMRNTSLGEYVSQVLIPTEKIYQVRNGKKIVKERSYLPGYVLVEAALVGEVAHHLRNITNVIGFLGGQEHPVPLRQSEVNRILGTVDELQEVSEDVNVPYTVGETVKVAVGPFSGFSGIIEEVSAEKRKLKVMVKIFGRKTPLELGFTDVGKE